MQIQGYIKMLYLYEVTQDSSAFFSKVQKCGDVHSLQEVVAVLNMGIFVPVLHRAVSPLQTYTDGIVSSWGYSSESVNHWKFTGI